MKPRLPFEPDRVQSISGRPLIRAGVGSDDRSGFVYVYHNADIPLAINIAIATRRPLLLSGPSGCGKSCLALNVALTLGWRYYEFVVNARSEARDMQWRFDTIRRLHDAQAKSSELKPDQFYVEPEVLWWAFSPETAAWRGESGGVSPEDSAVDPSVIHGCENAVVLIDEIDKADPDLPNNLLEPLGSLQFKVEPIRYKVVGKTAPLIFITTNHERELPKAFIRRCVVLEIPPPGIEELVEIAVAVIPANERDDALFRRVAELALGLAKQEDRQKTVSTAEYLDTLRACIHLGIDPGSADFGRLSRVTLQKQMGGGSRWD